MKLKAPKRKRVKMSEIDVERVLHHLGIEFKRENDELFAKCFHPEHKDKDPSWHIKAEIGHEKNGVFNCWSCHWRGNLLTLLRVKLGLDAGEAFELMERFSRKAPELQVTGLRQADYLGRTSTREPPSIGYKWKGKTFVPRQIYLNDACRAYAYLVERSIGASYVERFNLKDWSEKERIVVPITRRGQVISWVARSYVGMKPKTLAPDGAPKRWEVFGLDQMDRSIPEANISEGWVDAIRLMQAGRQNAVAICGSKMSEHQAEEFLFAKRIVLWLDGDKAGEVMGEDVVSWLGRDREILVVPTPPGKDPGDFSPRELAAMRPEPWSAYQRR